MHPTDELVRLLKRLKLSGVLQSLDVRVRQALDDDLTHGEFLLRLFSDEVERREAKQLDTRLRRASFEHGSTLEDFDFSFNPRSRRRSCSTLRPAPSSIGTRTSCSSARPGSARAISRRHSLTAPASVVLMRSSSTPPRCSAIYVQHGRIRVSNGASISSPRPTCS